MTDSNFSLRFNRTAREAYGHSIEFNQRYIGDQVVFAIAAFVAGLLTGLWLG